MKHGISLLAMLAVAACDSPPQPSSAAPQPAWLYPAATIPVPEPIALEAKIQYRGTRFSIGNITKLDWKDCTFGVSSKTGGQVYTVKIAGLKAGHETGIGAEQFADENGERFDIFKYKPMIFTVACMTKDGPAAGQFGQTVDAAPE